MCYSQVVDLWRQTVANLDVDLMMAVEQVHTHTQPHTPLTRAQYILLFLAFYHSTV